MGEVYRADDLKLGESVALKFLPRRIAGDEKALAGLHDEVRIARRITHPNVCRVYDIVDADGEIFISMEYIDGEDLAQLLRRIGRLPRDKALELARELCSGLAAAHEKGVLHRDLKPSNIMLDGRGKARITDFGIAIAADDVSGTAGTPAYMAPEQLAGKPASIASDIYSLGLVLYELFTGKPVRSATSVAELRRVIESGTVTPPSSLFQDIDPVVEKAILRCLEDEPRQRPHSVLALMAALPGGDPLAAALAAGETPSPELVAEAGEKGGLRPRTAVLALLGVLVLLVFYTWGQQIAGPVHLVRELEPPEVLELRVREHLEFLGWTQELRHRSMGYAGDSSLVGALEERAGEDGSDPWSVYSGTQPPTVQFVYRGSTEPMTPRAPGGVVTWDDPPLTAPGMVAVSVDPIGRLRSFIAPAPSDVQAPAEPGEPIDVDALFARTGLVIGEEIPSRWTPSIHCDERRAWKATYPGHPELELTVELGLVRGKPNRFEIYGPDHGKDGTAPETWLFVLIPLLVFAATGLLAWRNLTLRRGDRRGALRLAVYAFSILMLRWVFGADHQLGLGGLEMLVTAFSLSCGFAVFVWFVYIAIEPYARKHWPHSVVSSTRILQGRFRDPLVGRDLLLGTLLSMVTVGLSVVPVLLGRLGIGTPYFQWTIGRSLLGGRHVIADLFAAQTSFGVFGGVFLILLVLRIVLRRNWPAHIAGYCALTLLFVLDSTGNEYVFALLAPLTILATARLGLLPLAVFSTIGPLAWQSPATFDVSRWYFEIGLIGPLCIALIAGYGYWTSLAGQPLFRDEMQKTPLRAA